MDLFFQIFNYSYYHLPDFDLAPVVNLHAPFGLLCLFSCWPAAGPLIGPSDTVKNVFLGCHKGLENGELQFNTHFSKEAYRADQSFNQATIQEGA
jgi:hypothetical protein